MKRQSKIYLSNILLFLLYLLDFLGLRLGFLGGSGSCDGGELFGYGR